jgi:hypothetical protein
VPQDVEKAFGLVMAQARRGISTPMDVQAACGGRCACSTAVSFRARSLDYLIHYVYLSGICCSAHQRQCSHQHASTFTLTDWLVSAAAHQRQCSHHAVLERRELHHPRQQVEQQRYRLQGVFLQGPSASSQELLRRLRAYMGSQLGCAGGHARGTE